MSVRVRISGHSPCDLRSASPEEPTRLVDWLDQQEAWVTWLSCRSARCGVCRLTVLSDPHGVLAPADAEERSGLVALAAGARERLGCQLVIRAHAAGEVELAPR